MAILINDIVDDSTAGDAFPKGGEIVKGLGWVIMFEVDAFFSHDKLGDFRKMQSKLETKWQDSLDEWGIADDADGGWDEIGSKKGCVIEILKIVFGEDTIVEGGTSNFDDVLELSDDADFLLAGFVKVDCGDEVDQSGIEGKTGLRIGVPAEEGFGEERILIGIHHICEDAIEFVVCS